MAFFLGNSLMFIFGAAGAAAVGKSDISDVMIAQGLLIPAILVLGLNIWTTNDTALYASGLGFANITGLSSRFLAMLNGALGTLAALWLYNHFVGWLTFLSAAIPPIGGVIIADYPSRRRRYRQHPARTSRRSTGRRSSPSPAAPPPATGRRGSCRSTRCSAPPSPTCCSIPAEPQPEQNQKRSSMLIDNLRLRGREGLWQLRVADGRIAALVPMEQVADDAGERLDGAGGLAVPPFIEPHIHLDTTQTAGQPEWNRSGTLFEGIERWAQRKALLNTRTSSSAPGRP